MTDELDLDLDLEEEPINRAEKRIKGLSDKVRTTAEERDVANKAREEAEAKTAQLQKDLEFHTSFTDTLAKYPNASAYKDQIQEKVRSGYSAEDAAVAILAKEGKFTPMQPQIETPVVAGGSATTTPPSQAEKTITEMTQDERRQELLRAQERGDISLT